MKKRAMVMAVAAMMAAGALTACGGGSKDTAGTADTKAAEETILDSSTAELRVSRCIPPPQTGRP